MLRAPKVSLFTAYWQFGVRAGEVSALQRERRAHSPRFTFSYTHARRFSKRKQRVCEQAIWQTGISFSVVGRKPHLFEVEFNILSAFCCCFCCFFFLLVFFCFFVSPATWELHPPGCNDGQAVTSNSSCFLPKELQVTRFYLIVEWRSPPKIVTTPLVPVAVPYAVRELGGLKPVLIQI